MKQLHSKYSLVCATLLLIFFIASCDQKADPASSISTEKYPTVTVTSDLEGNTVTEGDTVNFKISMDRPPDLAIPFKFMIEDNDATTADLDMAEAEVTYPANTLDTVKVKVVFKQDDLPEEDESLSYKIGITDVGVRKLINPDSELPSGDLTLKNRNNPNGLTVVFDWNNPADDMDLVYVLYQNGSPVSANQDGATGSKPETIIDDSGKPGTRYYDVNPYTINETKVDYKFSIGYPDQSVEFYDGSFNFSFETNDDKRINQVFTSVSGDTLMTEPALGPGYVQLLKVTSTNNGSGANSFSVENLNSGGSSESGN